MSAHPALAGRDAEMTELRGLLDRAGAGATQLVLVTGEPGIGKTRIVDEATSVAAADGWTVLHTACVPLRGAARCRSARSSS